MVAWRSPTRSARVRTKTVGSARPFNATGPTFTSLAATKRGADKNQRIHPTHPPRHPAPKNIDMLTTPPVLFVIYNRPDLTAQSFRAIREAKPSQLFIAADGPRQSVQNDDQLCQSCRDFVQQVDWDCEVKTLFRDENLGCRRSMSSAITWFFTHVEEGIILEDDCVPDPSFFPYCAELLDHYRDDDRVMSICGENSFLSDTAYETSDSYVLSVLPIIWGWATWRRAWSSYDDEMTAWASEKAAADAMSVFSRKHDAKYWAKEFTACYDGTLDTWDYRWALSCIAKEGLHALPYRNLCSNVGFDERGTHTTGADSSDAERTVTPVTFPLSHPDEVVRDEVAEHHILDARFKTKEWYDKERSKNSIHRRVYRKLKRALRASA